MEQRLQIVDGTGSLELPSDSGRRYSTALFVRPNEYQAGR